MSGMISACFSPWMYCSSYWRYALNQMLGRALRPSQYLLRSVGAFMKSGMCCLRVWMSVLSR